MKTHKTEASIRRIDWHDTRNNTRHLQKMLLKELQTDNLLILKKAPRKVILIATTSRQDQTNNKLPEESYFFCTNKDKVLRFMRI